MVTRARALLIGVLVVSAIFIPSASQASATTSTVWGLEGCIYVPGRGGFEPGCRVASFGAGNYARAIVSLSGLMYACLWIGLGSGMLADPGCIFLGGMQAYGVFADPPALTVKIKGGETTFKSEVLGIKTEVSCNNMEAKEPEIESGGVTTAGKTKEAALVYSSCTVKKPTGCTVATPIETKPVETRLVENSGKTKIENLVKPQSGTAFAKIELKTCGVLNGSYTIEGTTLTEGGSEDELSNVKKNESEEKAGTDEDGEAVEKPKLKLAGGTLTISGEATAEAKFSGGAFKDEENKEEVTVAEEAVALGIDKE